MLKALMLGPAGLARSLPLCGFRRWRKIGRARPITVLMGFPAGSGVDVVARMLQPSLEKSLGQRLVHRLQDRRRRQRRLGGRRQCQARRLHLPARHGGDARRQSGALPEAQLRRRGRLHADLDPGRRLQRADHQSRGDRRQVGAGLHRQGEGRARQVQLRLDRQRHGHASRLRRVQRARPASTWCMCPTRAGPTPSRPC